VHGSADGCVRFGRVILRCAGSRRFFLRFLHELVVFAVPGRAERPAAGPLPIAVYSRPIPSASFSLMLPQSSDCTTGTQQLEGRERSRVLMGIFKSGAKPYVVVCRTGPDDRSSSGTELAYLRRPAAGLAEGTPRRIKPVIRLSSRYLSTGRKPVKPAAIYNLRSGGFHAHRRD